MLIVITKEDGSIHRDAQHKALDGAERQGGMALAPERKEQLISMIKEGKENKEISVFFKTTYQIEIPGWQFNYLRNKIKNGGGKKSRKVAGGGPKEPADVQNAAKDILKIVGQIQDGYFQVFKYLRLELLKSRGQVFSMMKGAGIEVPVDNLGD